MTRRQLALARAIERLSARDMREFVRKLIDPNATSKPNNDRWLLQERMLEYAQHVQEDANANQPS